jgi:hypothetical protein
VINASWVPLVQLVNKVSKEQLVIMGLKDSKVHLVQLEVVVIKVQPVQLVVLVY